MISHHFDTLLAKKSVSFRDFRVFGGARPCSARPRTRPLQCCLLCVTRILHVLPHGSSFCKPPRPIILIFIYTSNFPSLIPMPGPRNRRFYKRLRWVLRCRFLWFGRIKNVAFLFCDVFALEHFWCYGFLSSG